MNRRMLGVGVRVSGELGPRSSWEFWGGGWDLLRSWRNGLGGILGLCVGCN